MFNPLIKILLGLSSLLLVLFALEWYWLTDAQQAERRMQALSTFEELSLPQLDFTDQMLTNSQDMLKRPLFIEGRRPIEESQDQELTESSGDIDEFLLMGVYQVDDKPVALLKDKQQQKYEKKTEGETIAGWRIKQVLPDRIVVERQGKEKTVALRKPKPKTTRIRPGIPKPHRPPRVARQVVQKKP